MLEKRFVTSNYEIERLLPVGKIKKLYWIIEGSIRLNIYWNWAKNIFFLDDGSNEKR